MKLWGGIMANKKKKKVVKKNNRNSKKNNKRKNNTKRVVNKRIASSKNINTQRNKDKVNTTVIKNKDEPKKSKNADKVKVKLNISEKKLTLVTILVASVLIIMLIVLFISKFNSKNLNINFENINLEQYLKLYESEDLEFIYLYNDSCLNCDSYEANLRKLEEEQNIKIKKFDYSNLSTDELSTLYLSTKELSDGIEVPTIISIKEKQVINSISGVKEYSALKNFVNSSKTPLNVKSFLKINVDDYINLLNSKQKSLIYICNPTNSGCKKFTPLFETVSTSQKLKVNYLDTDTINTSEDWDKLQNSSKIYDGTWFMPAILIVKDGKVVDYKMEVLNEKNLIKFLKDNGL